MGQVDVPHVVAAADVVDLAVGARFDQQVDAAAMVVDVEPVANLSAVAVERHLQIVEAGWSRTAGSPSRETGTGRSCSTRA